VEGRDYCLPDDVKALVPAILGHRVVLNSRFSTTLRLGEETEKVLRDIVDSVPVPI
jgi:MoxR-like ATPase